MKLSTGQGSRLRLPVSVRAIPAQACVVAMAAAGCATGSHSPEAPTDTSPRSAGSAQSGPPSEAASDAGGRLELDNGSFVLLAPKGDGSAMDAQLSGTIVDVDGECLGLKSGPETTVLVLDHGTQVAADGRSVVTPDGEHLEVGDMIRGGGGGFTWDAGQPQPADWHLPPACYALGASSAVSRVELSPAGHD